MKFRMMEISAGMVLWFADRTVSAKAAEVKFVYQQVKLFPDVKGVKVINKRLFESTADLILNVEYFGMENVLPGGFWTD